MHYRRPISRLLMAFAVHACTVMCAEAPPTVEAIRQKVDELGIRDDTRPYREQPHVWLRERIEHTYDELVRGLDHPSAESAAQCLLILDGIEPRASLAPALIRIAGDDKHLSRNRATMSLCRFADMPKARSILEHALEDEIRFPENEQRATMAHALGRDSEAVLLLTPLLARTYDHQVAPIIQRLAAIGHRSAVPALLPLAHDTRWRVATAARLALASIAPDKHGLTDAQHRFLEEGGRLFKATTDFYLQRRQELSKLPHDEIRPFVMQMLDSDAPRDALGILRLWRDEEALPAIRRHIAQDRGWRARPFIAALLDIDDTDRAVMDALELLKEGSSHDQIMRAIGEADLPPERMLPLLRRLRNATGEEHPLFVPGCLRGYDSDIAPVLRPLLEEETDLVALGAYCRMVTDDAVYIEGLRRALGLLVNASADMLKKRAATYAVQQVCEKVASFDLPDAGRVIASLLSADNARIRLAAAEVAATKGGDRAGAIDLLHGALGDETVDVRRQASEILQRVPCATDAERKQREKAILQLLDTPVEDWAMRVLTTCCLGKAIATLSELMDGDDTARAVYAAWVLAQSGDAATARRGLRRVAIFALFKHQVYQAGEGIDFAIAPELSFHQVASSLNPGTYQRGESPVVIPTDLMVPAELSAAEQAFLLTTYRYLMANPSPPSVPDDSFFGQHICGRCDQSYVSFLRVVANEDPLLRVLHVQDQKAAHFPNRQSAARALVRLTGQPATYTGLTGEQIDSDSHPPGSYADQLNKVAKFVLQRIRDIGIPAKPETVHDWGRINYLNRLISRLTDEYTFGPALADELVAESQRQGTVPQLAEARLHLWSKKDAN